MPPMHISCSRRRQRLQTMSMSSYVFRTSFCGAYLVSSWMCNGFYINPVTTSTPKGQLPSTLVSKIPHERRVLVSPLRIYAPPGSGYIGRDPQNPDPNDPYALTKEEIDQICPPSLPSTYEPMLEYPGTMRPGRTPENMPYHDLPGLGIDDPDPVPWPHFQEIEWHHQWEPPHEQAPLMEDFIEMHGRWATVEEEAEMRMGMRRGVRERREMEESGGGGDNAMVIMDDDEEDESSSPLDVPSMMGLGDGVEALIGRKKADTKKPTKSKIPEVEEDDDDEEDDFLFDLGLGDDAEEEDEEVKPKPKKSKANVKASAEEEESEDMDAGLDDDDLDFELGFDLDDDDDIDLEIDDGMGTDADDVDEDFEVFDDDDVDVSIDDLNAKDDVGDDDDFDDGGFDYDD
ncbi:hypothetical protein HJC23_010251 [Cyclotella cryptica]|uniref:Uncharacterized protein n=1 Tax=Cyclotella cryptica TaxID=29204 RepID=A0ABD3Q1C1_9STRA|eukprot:CCRYP_009870-RA/>CCRYP_009870-RA protein AED:0.03 eAED:0.03 QI:339/1/1/1/1/1/2/306/400